MPQVLKEKIVGMQPLSPILYKLTIQSEIIAQSAQPGQFVNVKCSEGINALLRRPISICDVNREQNTVDIVFQVKGIGTEYLSKKQPGDRIDLIAPLGTGFDMSGSYKRIAVVGGGIGIFPLLFVAKEHRNAGIASFLGFRNKDFAVLLDAFEKASSQLFISTDDGSAGKRGLVVDQLEEYLQEHSLDVIYTCGPTPMLKKVVETAEKYRVPCQVSMEQRMGCGIGACLVCACKTKYGDEWEYSHVCKDGPVFWSREVIFD